MSVKQTISNYLGTVPDQVLRVKWLVWLVVIAATALAVAGMERTKFDMTIEGWFADDDPTIVAMDGFRARFGSDDHHYIIYKPKDGNVFSARSLETARQLRLDLQQRLATAAPDSPLRRIVKVTTLINAPVLKVEGDALVSRNLVGLTTPSAPAQLAEIARTAQSQRSLPLQYFSQDHKYGAILVETNFGAMAVAQEVRGARQTKAAAATVADGMDMSFDGATLDERVRFKPTDLPEYLDFVKAIEVTLNKPQFAGHFEYFPVGNPESTVYNMVMLEEMGMLFMLMLVMMVTVLWFLFRSLSGVLWPSLIVILSTVWIVGFAGWLGVPFTAFLMLTVVMILVIGIADSIHILSGYEFFRNQGLDHRAALRSAFRSSANACFITAVTTMVGMLSVLFTPIVPIQVFGATTAAGIGLAFLFSMYVLPVMLDLWWAPARASAPQGMRRKAAAAVGRFVPDLALLIQRMLGKVFPFVDKARYQIVAVAAAVLVVCLYGMSQVKVDTDFKTQFPEDAKIRTNMDIADQHMAGSQLLEIYLDLGGEYALHDPVVLKRIDTLQRTLETKYANYVVRTLSVVDVAKSSYQVLNDDRPEMNTVPGSRAAAANTLFLFDNSNPNQRRKMVSDDYSKCHITVYLRNAGSSEYTAVFKAMQQDIDAAAADLKQTYPAAKASVTGLFTLMMQGSDYLSWTSLASFGWAIITISVIMLLIFGSLKAGLVSVIANAIPVTLTFGLMGLLGAPLDFTTVLIAPIVLGIAVDDTIHFLTHYRQQVQVDGDVRRALVATIAEAGQAVTFTSLILALGFSMLIFSASPGNANVGIYATIAVLVGLVCELLVTPALVLISGLTFPHQAASGAGLVPAEPAAA